MRRRVVFLLLGAVLALLLAAAGTFGPYVLRVRRFPAEPDSGYSAPFFVYLSPGARRDAKDRTAVILVQPNNSGTNSDDPEVHQKDAWWTGFGRHWLADELDVILLIPAFPRPATDWKVYTHALDRDVLTTSRVDLERLDLQLLAMVDRARSTLAERGIRTEAKFLIQGFSASGMFANRFTALHPDRVMAAAAGAPGGWPIAPVASVEGEPLPYPAGVADLEQLTGRPFDSSAYRRVPQLIVMGALDDNDGLDFGDGWDSTAAEQVDRLFGASPLARWVPAQALYRAAGADVRWVLVEGIGHDRKALQPLTTQFFAEVLERR